jgi:hypothetical protein
MKIKYSWQTYLIVLFVLILLFIASFLIPSAYGEVRIYEGSNAISRPYGTTYVSSGGNLVLPNDTIWTTQTMDTTSTDTLLWTLVSHANGVEWFDFSSIVNYAGAGWDTINCPIDYGSLQVLTSDADSIYLWPNDTSATPLITSNSYKRLINNDLSRLIIRTFSSCTIEYHFEK